MPRGTIVVPSNLQPAFTFAPADPGERQTVLFNGSLSTAPANNPIVSYTWDFDDGGTASGRTVSHAFPSADTYIVTLTVADAARPYSPDIPGRHGRPERRAERELRVLAGGAAAGPPTWSSTP